MWSSEDAEEGWGWGEKIASLGNLIMNTISETKIPEWYVQDAALIPSNVYGSSRSQSLFQMAPDLAEVIGRQLQKMPTDPGTMFSVKPLIATPYSHRGNLSWICDDAGNQRGCRTAGYQFLRNMSRKLIIKIFNLRVFLLYWQTERSV